MRAINAIQLLRAKTPSPRSSTLRKNAVMKYGVGLIAGSFVIAIITRTNGSEAARAGMFRCACGESGKKRPAAKSETEKNNAPKPAATKRNPRRSISAGPIEIQRDAAMNVRTVAVAMVRMERRTKATPMATASSTSRQSQTADAVSCFETQIQTSATGSNGR